MSEQAYFSPSRLIFIPESWREDGTYTESTWPSDAVLLTSEQTTEYWKVTPPNGKLLTSVDGLPAWGDIPAPSHEQQVAAAVQMKLSLRASAEFEIDWRQGAVNEAMATDEEIAALSAWIQYRVLLMRVDTTKAPDIEWPPLPISSQ